ncbi:MAG: DNA repair protein RadA [Actinomycetota bacterium]|nr:DNA repair protein RadA [Actinomycetota bacterium]
MSKAKTRYLCNNCGALHLQWSGKCGSCGQWNALSESQEDGVDLGKVVRVRRIANRPSVCDSQDLGSKPFALETISTGSFEFDRSLGGGVTLGSVTLIGGEPGIGKSTLLTQFLATAANGGHRCLYVSAEESQPQVAGRISRLGGADSSIGILIANELEDIEEQLLSYKPEIVVVDSIQTVSDSSLASSAGSVNQVRECATRLSDIAKFEGIALLLVGHVTKDGTLAGPRVLEHLVDTVAYFEGDRDSTLRILRVIKHRFGPVGDLGMFEMGDAGLADLENATGVHLVDRVEGQPGSTVFPALDGRRVMLTEVQALVVPTASEQPRRVVTGLEMSRVLLLLAVLEKKIGVRLHNKDVFLSVTGGVRLSDPAADLAVIAAVVSSLVDRPVAPSIVFIGEVGLGGEIRTASNTRQRISEAYRLGFTMGIVGVNFVEDVAGVSTVRVKDVRAALAEASLHFR